jgi:ABC-type nitrate/sulfonate/bicarbonate transport system ATPase subunit
LNAKFLAGGPERLEVSIKSKAYRGASGEPHQALGPVAFALEKGEIGAVVGPSGCGKTTLLRIIAGLDTAFDGKIVRPADDRLAMVFQEPRLLPWRVVDDNVRLVAPGVGEDELAALLAMLGLSGHRRHYPGELSLGLARRVAVARAMAVHPDLLLLDEPFASLDAATAADLVERMVELVEGRPVTALMVTHGLDAAIELADVVFVLSERPARLSARIAISTPRRTRTPDVAVAIAKQIAAAQRPALCGQLWGEPRP